MTELTIQKGDITTLEVGAIVNAANSNLLGGGGVDGAIHLAGGSSIAEACKAIVANQGPCQPGEAVVTEAGELPAGIVIHTVGPVWSDLEGSEHERTLAESYQNCLTKAAQHNVRDIAFPNISTGAYQFPKQKAANVAVNATLDWIENTSEHCVEKIIFVCFDEENYEIYQTLLGW